MWNALNETSTEQHAAEESEEPRRAGGMAQSVKYLHTVRARPAESSSWHLCKSQARKCEPVHFSAGRGKQEESWDLLAR